MLAGEASGDALGAALISGICANRPRSVFEGIGGPKMLHNGLQSCFPMDPLSVMGLVEVLPRLPQILALRRRVVNRIAAAGYDALVTIDSPDFALGVARRVKKIRPRIPCIHYVSPTVWAWRPWRVRTLAASVDHVMTLFQFEADHLTGAGIASSFTGHPLADRVRPEDGAIAAVRAKLGLRPHSRIILLLPGSRAGEVRRHTELFRTIAVRLGARDPTLEFVVVSTAVTRPVIESLGGTWPQTTRFFCSGDRMPDQAEEEKFALFATAHAALAASGTVSIELAAMRTPMVIAYAMNWLSSRILGAMLTVDTVTLVNLMSDSRVVAEHLGSRISQDSMLADMTSIIDNDDARLHQLQAFDHVVKKLRHPAGLAGEQAAGTLLMLLDDWDRTGKTGVHRSP